MKKTLLTALLVAGAAAAYGQGTMGAITWGNNLTGFRAQIYGPDPGNASLSTTGQSSIGNPTGSTVYGGPLLGGNAGGTGFTFAFFAGPNTAASGALVLYGTTSFRTTASAAGLVNVGSATLSDVQAGQTAHFQIRVWNNQGGTLLTWAQAESAWLAGLTAAGVSAMVTSAPLGGTDSNSNSVNPPGSVGWQSFNIYSVPEPASFALFGLGAAGLMIFRRRK
jgi:hypothetical protein